MTKEPTVSKTETTTLTEQWKNGTLKDGYYYVKNKHFLGGETEYYHVFPNGVKYWGGCDDEDIEEILALVPSYDQFVELTKKVDELTTKCRQLEKKVKKRGMQIERAYDRYVAKRKENSELVQKMHILNEANMNLENTVGKFGEQLNEANKVIKFYANSFFGDKQKDGTYLIYTRENALGRVDVTYNPNIANNYLEKWGVK